LFLLLLYLTVVVLLHAALLLLLLLYLVLALLLHAPLLFLLLLYLVLVLLLLAPLLFRLSLILLVLVRWRLLSANGEAHCDQCDGRDRDCLVQAVGIHGAPHMAIEHALV